MGSSAHAVIFSGATKDTFIFFCILQVCCFYQSIMVYPYAHGQEARVVFGPVLCPGASESSWKTRITRQSIRQFQELVENQY